MITLIILFVILLIVFLLYSEMPFASAFIGSILSSIFITLIITLIVNFFNIIPTEYEVEETTIYQNCKNCPTDEMFDVSIDMEEYPSLNISYKDSLGYIVLDKIPLTNINFKHSESNFKKIKTYAVSKHKYFLILLGEGDVKYSYYVPKECVDLNKSFISE